MKPIFSLLCPTRERTQYLERLLGTLSDSIKNGDLIEVLFAYDKDDIITEAYLKRCRKRFKFNIRLFSRYQSDFLNRDYYNLLSSNAVGEFHWLIGDDLLFIKKDWDRYLVEKINDFFSKNNSRVLYIRIKDDTPMPETSLDYSNFPIISKQAIDIVGYFMPPSIPSWTGDYLVWCIYSDSKINRVLNIDEVLLNHISFHTDREIKESGRLRHIYTKYNVRKLQTEYEETELPIARGKILTFLQNYRRKTNELIPIF